MLIEDNISWMDCNMCRLCKNCEDINIEMCDSCGKAFTNFAPSNKLKQFMLQRNTGFTSIGHSCNIIICFQGVGASYMAKHLESSSIKCLDLPTATYISGLSWPDNYVNAIFKAAETSDIIFVEFNKDIYNALSKVSINNHNIMVCYPKYSLKDMWSDRLLNRGNTKDYVSFINANYDEWITWIREQKKFYPIIIDTKFDYICKHLNEMNLTQEQKDTIRKLT